MPGIALTVFLFAVAVLTARTLAGFHVFVCVLICLCLCVFVCVCVMFVCVCVCWVRLVV